MTGLVEHIGKQPCPVGQCTFTGADPPILQQKPTPPFQLPVQGKRSQPQTPPPSPPGSLPPRMVQCAADRAAAPGKPMDSKLSEARSGNGVAVGNGRGLLGAHDYLLGVPCPQSFMTLTRATTHISYLGMTMQLTEWHIDASSSLKMPSAVAIREITLPPPPPTQRFGAVLTPICYGPPYLPPPPYFPPLLTPLPPTPTSPPTALPSPPPLHPM